MRPTSKVKRMKLSKEVNNLYLPPLATAVDDTVVDPFHVLIYPSITKAITIATTNKSTATIVSAVCR